MVRIIDKIKERRQKLGSTIRKEDDAALLYYSFEFFPPKTEAGLDNLLGRIDRMTRRLEPLFIDVTWGSSGITAARSMAVASHGQKYSGVDVLLHLTCTTSIDQLKNALQQAKSCGIRNILVLRGDPPKGKRIWKVDDVSGCEFPRAVDLVKFIRDEYGDYFGVAVAGHPEGHPSSHSPEQEVLHLQQKIEAGADLIMTQFFYDETIFLDFVKRCRANGIECPILPGIMPIQSYSSFIRMTKYCNIHVPDSVLQRLDPVKDDDEAVKEIGVQIAVDMCQKILRTPEEDGGVDGIHFYTLNLERSVTRILMEMGAVNFVSNTEQQTTTSSTASAGDNIRTKTGRTFPWRPSAMEKRSKEEVRPINWANRPKSYVMRTEDWDEFPNGRWGDSTSPAFGELSDVSHFYSFTIPEEDRRIMLGSNPKTPQDVYEVFAKYVEGKVSHIPWCETPLQPESFLIQAQLASINRSGFLTINSQPSVNAASSTHPTFGWGGPGGYVYQKSYCECFASPKHTMALVEMVKSRPSLNLYAINYQGEQKKVGMSEEDGVTTALTWGVFPNREIVQPTIFDSETFCVWSEEAFSLWTTMWLGLYDLDSESFDLIETIRDTFYLVAIIDNEFTSSGESQIWTAMEKASQQISSSD